MFPEIVSQHELERDFRAVRSRAPMRATARLGRSWPSMPVIETGFLLLMVVLTL